MVARAAVWMCALAGLWLAWWAWPSGPAGVVRIPAKYIIHDSPISESGHIAYLGDQGIIVHDLVDDSKQLIPCQGVPYFYLPIERGSWLKAIIKQNMDVFDPKNGRKLVSIPVQADGERDDIRRTTRGEHFHSVESGRIGVLLLAPFVPNTLTQEIQVWDIAQGKQLSVVKEVAEPWCMDRSGQWIAARRKGSPEFIAFDAASGQLLSKLDGPVGGAAIAVTQLDNGKVIVVWRLENQFSHQAFAIWDPTGRQPTARFEEKVPSPDTAPQINPKTQGGRRLFLIHGGGTHIYDLQTNPPAGQLLEKQEAWPIGNYYALINLKDQEMFNFGFKSDLKLIDPATSTAVATRDFQMTGHQVRNLLLAGFDHHSYREVVDDLRTGRRLLSHPYVASELPVTLRENWIWRVIGTPDNRVDNVIERWPVARSLQPPVWLWVVTAGWLILAILFLSRRRTVADLN
jgi:hypothetical protein